MRGNLGIQLERKVESNIRILKEKDGVCVIYTEKSRHANIPREHGHKFEWDDKASTHASSRDQSKDSNPHTAERHFVEAIFDDPLTIAGLNWKAIHERIISLAGIRFEAARKRFNNLLKFNLIKKDNDGLYLPVKS
jgi:hypothetical protein